MGKFLRAVKKTARTINKINKEIERQEKRSRKESEIIAKVLAKEAKKQSILDEKEREKARKELFEKYKTVKIRLKVDESFDWLYAK
jgi:hypothetical protein